MTRKKIPRPKGRKRERLGNNKGVFDHGDAECLVILRYPFVTSAILLLAHHLGVEDQTLKPVYLILCFVKPDYHSNSRYLLIHPLQPTSLFADLQKYKKQYS